VNEGRASFSRGFSITVVAAAEVRNSASIKREGIDACLLEFEPHFMTATTSADIPLRFVDERSGYGLRYQIPR
jgi:hypothetical protein